MVVDTSVVVAIFFGEPDAQCIGSILPMIPCDCFPQRRLLNLRGTDRPTMPRTKRAPIPFQQARRQVPAHLNALASRARDYVEAANSANTRHAYASDWKHFSS